MTDYFMPIPNDARFARMQRRIDDQIKRVAVLEPGSPEHRIAVKVLLLLQDSSFVLVEAYRMLQPAREVTL